MRAARKLTAEQRAAYVWARPKLRLVQVVPVERERPVVSERMQGVLIGAWLIVAMSAFVARCVGWL